LFFLLRRGEIPYVFEVPTTLDALHDMIGNYASTGREVSLIIDRIHASNSVRLNKKNIEKMQNFYDVLLRRFIAVGDAIYSSGNGGAELARYEQLNALTRTLFSMSQDAPESAAAVWGRRLGVFQNAHAKRLRDA
jgi:nucleolar protein 14